MAELPRHCADSPQYQRGERILRERTVEYRQAKRELEVQRLTLLQLKGHRTPFFIEPALDRQLDE